MTGTVYLIHFDEPVKRARHYMGWTAKPVEERITRHTSGDGSRLMRAVVRAGIGFRVVRTWERVDRNFERTLKNKKCAPRLCPVCRKEK